MAQLADFAVWCLLAWVMAEIIGVIGGLVLIGFLAWKLHKGGLF